MADAPIVIVEDNAQHAELIQMAFTSIGVRTTLVPSGEMLLEALRMRQTRPRVILLDLKMPGMSGHEVLGLIRTTPDLQTVPVVVLTTSESLGDQRRALESGASAYLVKPTGMTALRDMASQLVSRWVYAEANRICVLSVELADPVHAVLTAAASLMGNVEIHRATSLFMGQRKGQLCITSASVASPRLRETEWNPRHPLIIVGDDDPTLIALGAEDVIPQADLSPLRLASAIRASHTRYRLQQAVDQRTSAINAFARRAAEELNAPARQIRSIADIVLSDDPARSDDASREHWVALLKQSSANMQRLTDDLISYTQQSLPHRPTHLNAAVNDALATLDDEHPDADIVTRIGPLPMVRGCPQTLATAFRNLVQNAFTYRAPNRKLVLEISSSRRQDGGATVLVSDNGRGIRRQDLQAAFDPLHRINPAGSGTGLGLAIVRRAMDIHGGTARLVSEVNVGTTVLLDFPSRAVMPPSADDHSD